MHIGVVAWEFPPEVGGMQTYAGEFVSELVRRRYEVTIFTRPHAEGEIQLPGATVAPILVGRRQPDWEALRSVHVDAWHVMNAAFSWLALEVAPVVVSVHGNDFVDPYVLVERPAWSTVPALWRWRKHVSKLESAWGRHLTRRTVRRALRHARHVIANSRYTEEVLLRTYPECAGRTSAGMVGVAERFFGTRSEPPTDGIMRLITVARLAERRKNVDVVIRALAQLKEKYRFSYTVVGDGFLREELEQLSRDVGLGDCVIFTGFVPEEQVRSRLAESDLFVLPASVNPTSHEGFGIAYLEANACGTPVLAARLAGAAEAVKEGETGIFVERADVQSVTGALERYLSGEVRFDADACRRFAREFSWSKVVDCAAPWYESDVERPLATEAL